MHHPYHYDTHFFEKRLFQGISPHEIVEKLFEVLLNLLSFLHCILSFSILNDKKCRHVQFQQIKDEIPGSFTLLVPLCHRLKKVMDEVVRVGS